MRYSKQLAKRAAIALLSILLLILFSGCGGKTNSSSSRRGNLNFAVEVIKAEAREVEFAVHAVGSVQAFEIVPVTSRVLGVVERVNFREGDRVSKDQPLVEIEPERYRLGLASVQALFDKAGASLQEARAGLKRREQILENQSGMISPEELEDWQTRVRTLEADSAYALASLEIARLNLRDAEVPAPVSGIIQERKVTTGQYVQTGTVIATIVRRDPLLLNFTVPETDSKRLTKNLDAQFQVRGDERDYHAHITAIAESADPQTRMVTITAEIDDPRRDELLPGTFAEVTVMLGEISKLPVIPQTAIRPSEKGFLAFVVVDSTALERILTLGMRSRDGMVEVLDGIQAGETVVIRGAEALQDGAGVKVSKAADIEADNGEGSGS
ncbi:efflux RND transporter periplasmic adaptor subunit [bacterium]|nr:MAG: efflux RND transporter periplasmic adaptor subunit [bacterium]